MYKSYLMPGYAVFISWRICRSTRGIIRLSCSSYILVSFHVGVDDKLLVIACRNLNGAGVVDDISVIPAGEFDGVVLTRKSGVPIRQGRTQIPNLPTRIHLMLLFSP